MVPTLALGIPGSATAAVIMGGLQVQGLHGPALDQSKLRDYGGSEGIERPHHNTPLNIRSTAVTEALRSSM